MNSPKIVDTHVHLLNPSRFQYDWLPGLSIDRVWTAKEYFDIVSDYGVVGALGMEGGVAPSDAEAEAQDLASDPRMIGVVAAAYPEDAGFPADLERLAELERLRGIRRVFHGRQDKIWDAPGFAENLRLLERRSLVFDLTARADQLLDCCRLVDACPGVQFVLDHCGLPPIASGDLEQWHSGIVELARRQNVSVKISGLVTQAPVDWNTDSLRPTFENVVACFGWDRLVWGSDFPVVTLNGTLENWLTATFSLVDGCSPDERSKLFADNAKRIYRIAAQ